MTPAIIDRDLEWHLLTMFYNWRETVVESKPCPDCSNGKINVYCPFFGLVIDEFCETCDGRGRV